MAQAANDDDTLARLDFGYYSSFLGYQAPLPVSWVAATRGLGAGPLLDRFTYLEAGSGQGTSLAVLADSYPDARFIGIEPEAGLIEQGLSLIREAGLKNIALHQAAIEDAPRLSLPPCDVVTLSRPYSWQPKDARRVTVEALLSVLKPGGFLCVQYGALPGNVHGDLLSLLFKTLAQGAEGDERQRLGSALARTSELARLGGLYFQQSPAAVQALAQLPRADARLAVREILHAEGRSLSHPEVALEMSALGLAYVGNGQIERNHLELVLAPAARTLVEGAKPQAARELLVDFALNTAARIDIYVKEPAPAREPADALAPFLIVRLARGEETLLRQQLAQRSGIDFTAGMYDDLLRLLGPTPMSVQEILDHESLRRHARARLVRALQYLVGMRLAQLVRTRTKIAEGPLPEKVKLASALNQRVLERWLTREDIAPMSSGVAGVRVALGPSDRIRLHAFMGGAVEPVLKAMMDGGATFTDAEGKAMTKEAFRDQIKAAMPAYRVRDAVYLWQLGVLVPA